MSGRPWLIAVTVEGVNLPRFLRRAGEMGLLLTGVRIRGKHLSAFAREDVHFAHHFNGNQIFAGF